MAIKNETVFDIFLPGIGAHVDSPEVKSPFRQTIRVCGQDFDIINSKMISICMWNRDNLSGAYWYIDSEELLLGEADADFEFNFSTKEDLMAFKLRWV